MTDRNEPTVLTASRFFAAPRADVFRAWTSAEHMKRWFAPEPCTVPEAEIDCRPGGVFALCMRLPDGRTHWCRGHFVEVSPPDRLSFDIAVEMDGVVAFAAHTVVTFEHRPPGTLLTARQTYTVFDPAARFAIQGAPEGWRSTLENLAAEVVRIQASEPRAAVHGTFRLERRYAAAPSVVFRALTDATAKARWFAGGDGWTLLERTMDARPGGRERLRGRWESGTTTTFDAVYFDVVADARLVYAYDMWVGERKISVSLATVELAPDGAGTRLTVVEQGAFLDGYDDAGAREHGTGMLLDRLGASLDP